MKKIVTLVSVSVVIILSSILGCGDKDPKYVEISSFDLSLRNDSVEGNLWLYEGDTCKYSDLRMHVDPKHNYVAQNFQFSLVKEAMAFTFVEKYIFTNRVLSINVFSSKTNSDYVDITDKCYFNYDNKESLSQQDIINEYNLLMDELALTYVDGFNLEFVIKFNEDISDSLLQNLIVEIEFDNGIISDTTANIHITN